MADFPVVDVGDWEVVREEPGGETAKDWLVDPENRLWLSKSVTQKFLVDGTPYRRGQDWAEKVAAEVANHIGLPAAEIELASRNNVPGLISRDLKVGKFSLDEAATFLPEIDETYVPWTESDKVRNRVGHNLENIATLLSEVAAPPGVQGEIATMSGTEVFAGYLLFDALVANADRHDRNWAVLTGESGGRFLSPTYDHGSALGSGLDPQRRRQVAASVERWCASGFAQRFEDGTQTTLLELAIAFGSRVPEAFDHWRAAIVGLSNDEFAEILGKIPVMSELERTFVMKVLNENRRRIQE